MNPDLYEPDGSQNHRRNLPASQTGQRERRAGLDTPL
jgi:hypothetical protein